MTSYRIVCTKQEPTNEPPAHAHIVAVGTGTTSDGYDRKWSLAEILQAMRRGDTFYTIGRRSGKRAQVESYACTLCHRTHIRSGADRVEDNNLDNLSSCR